MAVDRRKLVGWLGLVSGAVLALAAWALLIVVASRPGFRTILDTTPGQSASVRPGTEKLIDDLQDQDGEHIEIYSFFEKLPAGQTPSQRALVAILRRVQNLTTALLRQYAALGGEKVRVVHVDPRANPDAARKIIERLGGVKQRHVLVVAVVRQKEDGSESIQKRVIPVNNLAVIDYGSGNAGVPGANQRMPVFEQFTGEEQLSSAMKTLLAGGVPTVCLLKGHGEQMANRTDSPYDYTSLFAGLQAEGFKFEDLVLTEGEIPEHVTVIACLEPETEFDDSECEKIHAWLKRGGRMFLNAKYHDVSTRNPKLRNLLEPLGLVLGDRMVMQAWDRAPASKAAYLEIYPKNTALPITQQLVQERRTIGIRFARPIENTESAVDGVSVDRSLLRTQRNCWLAERISGAETSYQAGDPSESYCVGAIATVKPERGQHPGKLILIGGIGFNNNNFDTGSQKDFALNSMAWLADRQETITLRERPDARKSNVIRSSANPDEVAKRMGRVRDLLLFVVPGGFLVLGLIVWWRRRRI